MGHALEESKAVKAVSTLRPLVGQLCELISEALELPERLDNDVEETVVLALRIIQPLA